MTRGPGSRNNVPIPDPSLLTTEQLHHEIATLRELLEARLTGMDRATKLLGDGIIQLPAAYEASVQHLKDLHDERFLSVAQQFQERDIRHEQAAAANKRAVDAALTAARELVDQQNAANATAAGKAEAAFTKQFDGVGRQIETMRETLAARLTDLKERLDRGEGATAGATGFRHERRLDTAQVVAVISLALLAVSVIVTVIIATRSHG